MIALTVLAFDVYSNYSAEMPFTGRDHAVESFMLDRFARRRPARLRDRPHVLRAGVDRQGTQRTLSDLVARRLEPTT